MTDIIISILFFWLLPALVNFVILFTLNKEKVFDIMYYVGGAVPLFSFILMPLLIYYFLIFIIERNGNKRSSQY